MYMHLLAESQNMWSKNDRIKKRINKFTIIIEILTFFFQQLRHPDQKKIGKDRKSVQH